MNSAHNHAVPQMRKRRLREARSAEDHSARRAEADLCDPGCGSPALLSSPELCSRLNLLPWSGMPALINKYLAAGPHTVSSPHLQDSSLARSSACIPEAHTEVKCYENCSPILPRVPVPLQQTPCGSPIRYCETQGSEHISH